MEGHHRGSHRVRCQGRGDGVRDIDVRLRDDETYREAILAWLRVNDIDPHNVPVGCKPTIADGRLTIELRTVTVPVLVPPTPEVELWLLPRCEACGR